MPVRALLVPLLETDLTRATSRWTQRRPQSEHGERKQREADEGGGGLIARR
ncbi:MAG: hypothetical protein M3401_13400 [Actinomycetota bacterium]|nr:hypothetical protein [Actinomycetota bacterium]